MTIDLYIPFECVWYSLILIYIVGHMFFARYFYKFFSKESLDSPDFDKILSSCLAFGWPIFALWSILSYMLFFGIKDK